MMNPRMPTGIPSSILGSDTHYAQRFYDNRHVKYHIEFFRTGITQMIKIWLVDNCDLPPE